MQVSHLLLETLEELVDDDFRTFKWYLATDVLDGCRPIPKSRLDKASRTETVTKMIASYCHEPAVKVTVEILKSMNFNDDAEKLKNRYAEGQTASASTSSASASSATPATMSAHQGSVIIAPNINGSTTGSLNITINKS
ncbi:putative NACHT LRR and PYD domains-containing protein 10-like isoform 4 [Scophthalmus maximus]|uniref:Putative NACHT LRR and PYD domains-containing protein 10-like n=1 Tax=Scophthalmus maximus TaxID=52904 RepID=A0A2U9BNR8_SCOMX|nr:putative NACHT LRR and PYD domains-containing protein 10-like [Scophthalmus maximus]AWP05254.1 putative NACHT LRR and PYD domains-containing protein 10-like isoform 2 [Scophthalmus maximus]AWP05255.1 putative NACHT LRR and PYD domains-containing protein 10-like isoform 3 [Scophthalmus maximus]AWP05256.1 putative NACHT LRR and PYD domains-containing protein 10-like isoform 4 [Scophthalmus maximus]